MLTDPLHWKLLVCAKGCVIDDADCDGPIQAHHIIGQKQLRKHGKSEYLWHTQNGMALCYHHHRRHENATQRVPYSKLLPVNIAFANWLGLGYLLDRYYPKEKQMNEEKLEKLEKTFQEAQVAAAWADAFRAEAAAVDSSSPDYLHPAESVADAVAVAEPLIEGPAQVERCPTCERALPKPHKDEEERVRKGWTIAVPVDERENGADVLDSLLEECRKLFGHDENRKVRYYTVVQALALVVQNGTQLAVDDAA